MLKGCANTKYLTTLNLIILALVPGLLLFSVIAYQLYFKEATKLPIFKDRFKEGNQIYQLYCASCHQPNGGGVTLGAPALRKGMFSSSYLTTSKSSSENIDIVLNGVEDTPMMGFKNVLTDEKLADVLTYIRNAWGNDAGDLITPQQIIDRKNAFNLKQKESGNPTPQQYSMPEQMIDGKVLYRAYCARCHQLDGSGKAPYGPKLDGSYLAKETILIPYKIDLLLKGAPGTRMRSYAKQLSDTELAAVTTYIANAWHNNGNQLIEPQMFSEERIKLKLAFKNPDKLIEKQYSYDQLMTRGKISYLAFCARCHLPDGVGGAQPGVPSLKGSTLIMKGSHEAHIDLVLLGVPGSIMRSFGNRLTNLELAAILTYERNAWGNNKDDLIQPSEVKIRKVLLQKQIDYQNRNQLMQQSLKEEEDIRK